MFLFRTRAYVAALAVVTVCCLGSVALADQWQNLAPGNPPPGRDSATGVYDVLTNRMIIFGGNASGSITNAAVFNDTWVLSNANGADATPPGWTMLTPAGSLPPVRWGHSAVYDDVNNRMIVFGGHPNVGGCGPVHGDLWVLKDANGMGSPEWIQLVPAGATPGAKVHHVAGYDSASNRMIIFQGGPSSCVQGPNTVWILNNANGLGGAPSWEQLAPTGGPPPSSGAEGVYDEVTNRLICWFYFPDQLSVWVLEKANGLDGAPNWIQLATAGTIPERSFPGVDYNSTTNQLLVFGGAEQFGAGDGTSDVFVLDNANGLGGPAVWTHLSPDPDPDDGFPGGRVRSPVVVDPVTGRMTVFSGLPHGSLGPIPYNDTWVLIPTVATIEVDIDIKPDSDPNSINLRANGVLPVAIFSTEDFDALEIDEETVLFGDPFAIESGDGVPVSPLRSTVEDVDGDGLDDLLLFFSIPEIANFGALDEESIGAMLTGETFDGVPIVGRDDVRIVPPPPARGKGRN